MSYTALLNDVALLNDAVLPDDAVPLDVAALPGVVVLPGVAVLSGVVVLSDISSMNGIIRRAPVTCAANVSPCATILDMSPKHVEEMYDAVIVGAGAAGLSAALGLMHSPDIEQLKESGIEPKVLVISNCSRCARTPVQRRAASRRVWAMWNRTIGIGITTTPSRAATGWSIRMRPSCSPSTPADRDQPGAYGRGVLPHR